MLGNIVRRKHEISRCFKNLQFFYQTGSDWAGFYIKYKNNLIKNEKPGNRKY